MLFKKKSKSIDARKSDNYHYSHNQSIDTKHKKIIRQGSKKSVDLSSELIE